MTQIETNSKCVICGKRITYTISTRRFCRGGQCKKLFYKLKVNYTKGNLKGLHPEEIIVYKKLLRNHEFIKNPYKRLEEKPFIV